MITKDELAAMIAALEAQPHLSLKEEKYLAVCKSLMSVYDQQPYCYEVGGIYCNSPEEANMFVGTPTPLFDNEVLN